MTLTTLIRVIPIVVLCCLVRTNAQADPPVGGPPGQGPAVPVSATPPLFCMTPNFMVQANIASAFPLPNSPLCGGTACLDFGYTVTPIPLGAMANIDHVAFSVSATQAVLGPPAVVPTGTVLGLGVGDLTTGFLAFTQHEYGIRFNGANALNPHILIAGTSAPVGLSTVVIRANTKQPAQPGKQLESCLIAGPGAPPAGDVFQPVLQAQTAVVAGGKCIAHFIFDPNGNLMDVTADSIAPGVIDCHVGSPTDANPLLVNGFPLRNNTSPNGITFGNGTTTCYGPPIPSVPRCICTRSPCP